MLLVRTCASLALAVLSLAIAACDPRDGGDGRAPRGGGPPIEPVHAATTSASSAEAAERSIAPLEADDPVSELFVPGHLPAVAVVPIGATGPRPVVVAAHGQHDRPEPICETLRIAVDGRAFVVCPRGIASEAREGAFTYASADALADEVHASLRALRRAWPDHVDPGPIVYAGFSLGAYHGVRRVTRDPSRTPRVILIEGGQDPWTDDRVRAFVEGGGARVLFATGQDVNEARARAAARTLDEAGAAARVIHVDGAGHVHDGELGLRIAESFDWVVEGDARFGR